jgi:hemoglobin
LSVVHIFVFAPRRCCQRNPLGGVYSIATVVDDLIERIMIDPRLNANPKVDEAHHRVPRQASSISLRKWSAGLPADLKSTGRSMKASHQHLMIAAAEWEAFLDDLQQTLDKFAAPQAEQANNGQHSIRHRRLRRQPRAAALSGYVWAEGRCRE